MNTPPIPYQHLLPTALMALLLSGCGGSGSGDEPPPPVQYPDFTDVVNLGGDTTVPDASNSGHGFSTPAPNLSQPELARHLAGDAHFETSFTTAPNSQHPELDGLGPVFNNSNCNACHQRDGRSSTLINADGQYRVLGTAAGIFARISLKRDHDCSEQNASNDYCAPIPVPDFGTQMFHRGVLKARPDWQQHNFIGQADIAMAWQRSDFTYPDGSVTELLKPDFRFSNAYDSPDDISASSLGQANVVAGLRNGMPVFGLGLLELIPEAAILALADENDDNNDGISGRPNRVFDAVKAANGDSLPLSLGRFGWKASTPSVRQQSLGALRGDIGITNSLFPQESVAGTALHHDYLARTHYQDSGSDEQGLPESSQAFDDEVVFYAETLGVPARRDVAHSDVREGARLFAAVNCSGCHTPSFTTASSGNLGGVAAPAGLLNQTIYPFTDMLLHDMGPELADGRSDFVANGNEWKTRPLWGIGLTQTVNPAACFLHDGRACTVEEAILWHGGEAQTSRDAFSQLSAAERRQLLAFVRSL
ncbi:di-heme oxidoredictase family protein [uncultured Ferrimonas sp.]|uniref:di-heme oxidoredictase family protein n=1 Tax=uncultured Ferrimonas sp. TaxID=432640 RepID=UPI0026143F1B|nr:di-heme oxidoredictase family protein [uncultured Ferrimonas sp.]